MALVGTETYYVTTAGQRQPVLASIAKEFSRVSYIIKDQTSFYPEVISTCRVNVNVPIDAPPSCHGRKVDVNWILQAVLDLQGHRKKVKEVPVQIMSTPVSAGKALTTGEKSYKDCVLSLEVPVTILSKGTVSGRLQVEALREFQMRGIRVELRQIEDASCDVTVNDVIAQQDLSGPVSLGVRESPSFAFSLPLPSDAPPTMKSPHSSLRWQVRAILDRRLHPDFHIEKDVFIYNSAGATE